MDGPTGACAGWERLLTVFTRRSVGVDPRIPIRRFEGWASLLFGVEGVFDPVEVAGACGLLLDQQCVKA